MAEFVWEARGRAGEVRKGTMEADSETVVQNRLRAQQLNPTKVKKKGAGFSFALGQKVEPKAVEVRCWLCPAGDEQGVPGDGIEQRCPALRSVLTDDTEKECAGRLILDFEPR